MARLITRIRRANDTSNNEETKPTITKNNFVQEHTYIRFV